MDSKSGVSARLTISGYENLVSTAERRLLINRENKTIARLTDFWGVVPAITGKVELVYEGEQEGPYLVAINLLGKSLKKLFLDHFPDPDKLRKGRDRDPYGVIRAWFSGGNALNLLNDMSDKDYRAALDGVAGLRKFVEANLEQVQGDEQYLYMELVLHGLAEFQVISKDMLEAKLSFRDTLADMLSSDDLFDEDDE